MLTPEDLVDLDALRGCSRADLAGLLRAAHVTRIPANTPMITQGDHSGGGLLIISGACRAEIQVEGRRLVLGRVGAGKLVGELGLYTQDLPRSATLIAEEEVVALVLDTAILDDPRARGALRVLERRALTLLAERVRRNTAHIRRWSEKGAPQGAEKAEASLFSGISRAFRRALGGTE